MRLKTVLCPIDFTSLSDREVHLGATICQRFGARLVLHHSLSAEPQGLLGTSWLLADDQALVSDQEVSETYLRFQRLLEELPPQVERLGKLSRGPIQPALFDLARDLPADLIVMGSHGWSTTVHRSVTEKVLAEAPCPVLTIRDDAGIRESIFGAEGPTTEVALVPVDLTDYALTGFDYALEILDSLPVRLSVVHVEREVGTTGPECRERLNARLPQAFRDRFELHVVAGNPALQVLALAESLDASLIVMGCHRKGVFDRFMHGSNAYQVLHQASCPVWFLPEKASFFSEARVEQAVLQES